MSRRVTPAAAAAGVARLASARLARPRRAEAELGGGGGTSRGTRGRASAGRGPGGGASSSVRISEMRGDGGYDDDDGGGGDDGWGSASTLDSPLAHAADVGVPVSPTMRAAANARKRARAPRSSEHPHSGERPEQRRRLAEPAQPRDYGGGGGGDGDGDGDDDDEESMDAGGDEPLLAPPPSLLSRQAAAAAPYRVSEEATTHSIERTLGRVGEDTRQLAVVAVPASDEYYGDGDGAEDIGYGGMPPEEEEVNEQHGTARGDVVDRGDGDSDGERAEVYVQRRAAANAAIDDDTRTRVRRGAQNRDYARLVDPPATHEEEEHQIENDDDALRWRAVKHPHEQELLDRLGAPQPRDECFGCTHGDKNASAVSSHALDRMREFYVKNRMEMSPDALGTQLAAYYEKHIRGPSLDPIALACGDAPLPEWRAATIVEHFRAHRKEPQAKVERRIEQVGALADHLFDNGVYVAPATMTRPKASDVRVREKTTRMAIAAVKLEVQLYGLDPKQMFGYNEDFRLDGASRAFVRSRYNMVDAIRKRTVFDAEAPAPP